MGLWALETLYARFTRPVQVEKSEQLYGCVSSERREEKSGLIEAGLIAPFSFSLAPCVTERLPILLQASLAVQSDTRSIQANLKPGRVPWPTREGTKI